MRRTKAKTAKPKPKPKPEPKAKPKPKPPPSLPEAPRVKTPEELRDEEENRFAEQAARWCLSRGPCGAPLSVRQARDVGGEGDCE
jgi:hypothetical protein